MLSKTMEANEMLSVGFLSDLVSIENLYQTVDDYQKSIIECDSSVSLSMKKNIDAITAGDLRNEVWTQKYRQSLGSDEMTRRLSRSKI